jgi:hypothetical protein
LDEFGLDFAKILKTMIDEETIIFCGEYLKEDLFLFVFEKLMAMFLILHRRD